VPTLKISLPNNVWQKWTVAKAELGSGSPISSKNALEKIIDEYNKNKGRRIL